jgi:hypothetical protein
MRSASRAVNSPSSLTFGLLGEAGHALLTAGPAK